MKKCVMITVGFALVFSAGCNVHFTESFKDNTVSTDVNTSAPSSSTPKKTLPDEKTDEVSLVQKMANVLAAPSALTGKTKLMAGKWTGEARSTNLREKPSDCIVNIQRVSSDGVITGQLSFPDWKNLVFDISGNTFTLNDVANDAVKENYFKEIMKNSSADIDTFIVFKVTKSVNGRSSSLSSRAAVYYLGLDNTGVLSGFCYNGNSKRLDFIDLKKQ